MALGTVTSPQPTPVRRRHRVRSALVLVLVALLGLAVAIPLVAATVVVTTARADDRTPTDAVVVLGAAQFWGRPSPVLENRLAHAAALYDEGVAPRVITVGGKQPGDNTTEAQAGKEWLDKAGVPAKKVIAVPTGSDTAESIDAVVALMAEKGWTSATIVTDPVHMARSLALGRQAGLDVHGAPTQDGAGSSITVDYVLRETGGLLHAWIVDRWS